MALFDPIENARRVREGLGALVREKVVEWARASRHLIVVYPDVLDELEGGRIIRFQEFVRINAGVQLEVVKKVPGCTKVFFAHDDQVEADRSEILVLLRSEEFVRLCDELDISYVQFAGEIMPKLQA